MAASRRNKTGEGFALLEMLVTVGTIGILASILLPSLAMAKKYSLSTSCKNHLKQLGISLAMYTDDNAATYTYYLGPAGPSYGDDVARGGRAAGLVYWSSKLFPYYHENWTNAGDGWAWAGAGKNFLQEGTEEERRGEWGPEKL